jgi:hypothetical protein
MIEPIAVLDRFSRVINRVITSIMVNLELPSQTREDIHQDASILLLSYAGVIEGIHHKKLFEIENLCEDDETRIETLISETLKHDLNQRILRELNKQLPFTDESLDMIVESSREPGYLEDVIDQMDETRLRQRYPEFVMFVIDGLTQEAIAEIQKISIDTVQRRIFGQKRSFLLTRVKQCGIVVEGDESIDELEEAYQHAQVVRK